MKESTLLYDADCRLCTGAVEFIRHRARRGEFRFVPLTSDEAVARLEGGPPPGDTLILFDAAGRHDRSTAALRIAAELPRPWAWLRHLSHVPIRLRDRAYDLVARRRLRWLDRSQPTCGPDSRCPHPGKR